jgi:hypothetical protein
MARDLIAAADAILETGTGTRNVSNLVVQAGGDA